MRRPWCGAPAPALTPPAWPCELRRQRRRPLPPPETGPAPAARRVGSSGPAAPAETATPIRNDQRTSARRGEQRGRIGKGLPPYGNLHICSPAVSRCARSIRATPTSACRGAPSYDAPSTHNPGTGQKRWVRLTRTHPPPQRKLAAQARPPHCATRAPTCHYRDRQNTRPRMQKPAMSHALLGKAPRGRIERAFANTLGLFSGQLKCSRKGCCTRLWFVHRAWWAAIPAESPAAASLSRAPGAAARDSGTASVVRRHSSLRH